MSRTGASSKEQTALTVLNRHKIRPIGFAVLSWGANFRKSVVKSNKISSAGASCNRRQLMGCQKEAVGSMQVLAGSGH